MSSGVPQRLRALASRLHPPVPPMELVGVRGMLLDLARDVERSEAEDPEGAEEVVIPRDTARGVGPRVEGGAG